jgi:predicted glycoside hydrolase/deacetylase ChbG (UPF0249 family)
VGKISLVEKVQDVMDKSVLNKQQVLANEVSVKLKTESEIVLNVEQTHPKTIDEKKERVREYKLQKKRNKSVVTSRNKRKFVEEEQGHIIDLKS